MLLSAKSSTDVQTQRTKLANSYNALLQEFSSKDLTSVGNYSLGHLIGKGSFGKVYLANHKLTNGSKVVLKSAKKDDANLAREIHHHRQFLHPHIARLYEVIVTESLVWLVLEYCPGDELYHYVTQHGPLPPSTVQKIFAQIIGAVSHVHGKSCVHRDLKLENILLDKNQNVKLCDFGFTREYEGKSSYLQTWCGTVCYSAPEMLKGEKYAGEKVDVWSLGIILYALLCGELPFDDDDEGITKARIIKDEPRYPETMPPLARELISSLLSKRPLLRPSLAEILTNPWLSEHAPQQQAILKLQQPAPFSTPLEKETLLRMRSSGVDTDKVIENVLSQRCDALAGWWALSIEKEERKQMRRDRKRKEREVEAKALRRISAASARLERIAPTIKESDEESALPSFLEPGYQNRGRGIERPGAQASGSPPLLAPAAIQPTETETNALSTIVKPEVDKPTSSDHERPASPPTQRDHISGRVTANARRRSQLGPRDYRKRNSGLHLIAANPELLNGEGVNKKRKHRYQQPFLSQLASIKHWFKDSAKRGKSPNPKFSSSVASLNSQARVDDPHLYHPPTKNTTPPKKPVNTLRTDLISSPEPQPRPRISSNFERTVTRRASQSPSPMTPSSSYRRHAGSGVRGRKSASSSVSSVRSIHAHHASLSMASSTSSNSVASPSLSAIGYNRRSSPNTSNLKVLANTPANTLSFPTNIRVVRAPPPTLSLSESNAAFSGLGPPSPGLIFAKRKRSPFKGPMLGSGTARRRSESGSVSRQSSVHGRPSGEIIEEEEDIEEVDSFSPHDPSSPVEEAGLGLNIAKRDPT